jgi:hypothetical protein
MKFIFTVVVLALACPVTVLAEHHVTVGHVVHTRRAPVIAHKVVPPFKGVHVYEGRAARH